MSDYAHLVLEDISANAATTDASTGGKTEGTTAPKQKRRRFMTRGSDGKKISDSGQNQSVMGEETEEPKIKHYEVLHNVTKAKVGQAKSRKRATTILDKKDNEYGGYIHHLKPVYESMDLQELLDTTLKSYVTKANADSSKAYLSGNNRKAGKRFLGVHKAMVKLGLRKAKWTGSKTGLVTKEKV